jgi:hypothetical protein
MPLTAMHTKHGGWWTAVTLPAGTIYCGRNPGYVWTCNGTRKAVLIVCYRNLPSQYGDVPQEWSKSASVIVACQYWQSRCHGCFCHFI